MSFLQKNEKTGKGVFILVLGKESAARHTVVKRLREEESYDVHTAENLGDAPLLPEHASSLVAVCLDAVPADDIRARFMPHSAVVVRLTEGRAEGRAEGEPETDAASQKEEGEAPGADFYIPADFGSTGFMTDIRMAVRVMQAEARARIFERKWQSTFNALGDGIAMFDEHMRLLRCNKAFLDMTGLKSDQAISRSWDEIAKRLGWNIPDVRMPAGKDAAADGAVPSADLDFETPDGRYLRLRQEPVTTDDMTVVRKVIALSDITQQKRAEKGLRESEEQFRVLANSIPQMAWMTNSEGRPVWYNQRWYDFTGLSAHESTDSIRQKTLHPDHRERVARKYDAYLRSGSLDTWEDTMLMRGNDGDYRWFLSRAVPIPDGNRKILRWFGTHTDITEQRNLEENLRLAKDRAEAANIAKSEFLANMSHEIRTPMNVVIGVANILASSAPLTADQQKFIKTLQISANSLLALINDLLDISKIESGAFEAEKRPFRLDMLLNEIVSVMSVKAAEKSLAFRLRADAVDGKQYIGDMNRLRQIIYNLMANAIKFTENGEVGLDVACDPSDDKGVQIVRITVRDTGIGIDPDKKDIIFQKFQQADSSISRKYGGTGLGLTITKTFIDAMDGTIEIESLPGKGSSFVVTLPMRIVEQAADDAHAPPAEAVKPRREKTSKILLVEDYAPNVLVAITILEMFGYEADVATGGHEAYEKIKENSYGIVLMDVQMPGMSGLEVTERVRQYEKANDLPAIPIIGMTAHAFASDREKCLAAGMDDYISKPFDLNDLKEKISALLARW